MLEFVFPRLIRHPWKRSGVAVRGQTADRVEAALYGRAVRQEDSFSPPDVLLLAEPPLH
jgi:hypothetical protein